VKKSIVALMVLALTGSAVTGAIAAQENTVKSTTIAQLSDVKTMKTQSSTKVDLPVVETSTLVSKKSEGVFSGHSLKLYNVSVVRKEIKSLSDVQPFLVSGKLFVKVSDKAPIKSSIIYSASSAQSEPFLYIITKEHAYIQSAHITSTKDRVDATLTPAVAKEGFYLLIDSERTKDNNLLSKITLTEKRITNLKELEEKVSLPSSKEFSASNRVFSKPGETLTIHSVVYKENDKNYQNIYSITIR